MESSYVAAKRRGVTVGPSGRIPRADLSAADNAEPVKVQPTAVDAGGDTVNKIVETERADQVYGPTREHRIDKLRWDPNFDKLLSPDVLMRWCELNHCPIRYEFSSSGPSHAPVFTCVCRVFAGVRFFVTTGSAISKAGAKLLSQKKMRLKIEAASVVQSSTHDDHEEEVFQTPVHLQGELMDLKITLNMLQERVEVLEALIEKLREGGFNPYGNGQTRSTANCFGSLQGGAGYGSATVVYGGPLTLETGNYTLVFGRLLAPGSTAGAASRHAIVCVPQGVSPVGVWDPSLNSFSDNVIYQWGQDATDVNPGNMSLHLEVINQCDIYMAFILVGTGLHNDYWWIAVYRATFMAGGATNRSLLIRAGDVETNPGPHVPRWSVVQGQIVSKDPGLQAPSVEEILCQIGEDLCLNHQLRLMTLIGMDEEIMRLTGMLIDRVDADGLEAYEFEDGDDVTATRTHEAAGNGKKGKRPEEHKKRKVSDEQKQAGSAKGNQIAKVTNGEELPADMPGDQASGRKRTIVKMANFNAVLSRLTTKLTSVDKFLDWLLGVQTDSRPAVEFAKLIWERSDLSAKGGPRISIRIIEKILYGGGDDEYVEMTGLLELSPNGRVLMKSDEWCEYVDMKIGTRDWPCAADIYGGDYNWVDSGDGCKSIAVRMDTSIRDAYEAGKFREGGFNPYGNGQRDGHQFGFIEMTARARNRKMHTLNGNQAMRELPLEMKDIDALPSIRGTMSTKSSFGRGFDPVVKSAQHAGIQTSLGITLTDVPRLSRFTMDAINNTNIIEPALTLPLPEKMLVARDVRPGPAAPVGPAANRLSIYNVGLLRRKLWKPLIPTELFANLSNEVLQKLSNIRNNQVSPQGAYLIDVLQVGALPVRDGDTLLAFFLKLQLYSLALGWERSFDSLPLGGMLGNSDAWTRVAQNGPDPVIDYNDSPVFGEDCGGATAVFPFIDPAQTVPTVAFYASYDAIPSAYRTYTVFISAQLLQVMQVVDDTSLAIVLTLLGAAPFPCGLHTVTVETQDDTGGNVGPQSFIPISELNRIPGMQGRINVVLPVSGANPPPVQNGAATAAVLVRPRTGPTASTGLAANTDLIVNGSAGPLVEYDLAEFIYTWLAKPNSPITSELIWLFCVELATVFGRYGELKAAGEKAAKLSARWPAMQVDVPGSTTIFPAESVAAEAEGMWNSSRPTLLLADIPVNPGDAWDLTLDDFNPLAFSKVMIGAQLWNSDGESIPLDFWGGAGAYLVERAMWVARSYAALFDTLYLIHGYPASVWNQLFGQAVYRGIRTYLRKYYARSIAAGVEVIYASKAQYLTDLYRNLFNCDPAHDLWGVSLDARVNMPRQPLSVPVDVANNFYDDVVPGCLNDYWRHDIIERFNLASAPFLPPLGRMTGKYADDMRVIPLNGPLDASVPVPVWQQMRSIGIDEIPLPNDNVVWNSRVVWHSFTATLFTTDGVPYPGAVPAGGSIIAQRYITPDYTLPNEPAIRIVTAKTDWIPLIAPDGRYIVTGVTAANNANLMSQVMAGRAFATIETLLANNLAAVPPLITDVSVSDDPFPDRAFGDFSGDDLNSHRPSEDAPVMDEDVS